MSTWGYPTTSTATSAPRPSVSALTRSTLSSAVAYLVDVDGLVGPALLGKLKPVGLAVYHDHLPCSHLFGGGAGVDPEATCSLHYDGVAQPHFRLVQPVDHLRDRAVDGGHRRVRQLVRDLEHEVSWKQVVVVSEAAIAVRELFDRRPEPPAIWAMVQLSSEAEIAAPARKEIGEGDPVTLL